MKSSAVRRYIPCKYCSTLIFFHKKKDNSWFAVEETGEIHKCSRKKSPSK